MLKELFPIFNERSDLVYLDTAATALNDLKINAEDGSGETAAITISGDIGTNTTAGLRGDLDIGNANTATLDLEGSFYNTTRTQDYTAVNTGTNIAIKGSSAKFITANKDLGSFANIKKFWQIQF